MIQYGRLQFFEVKVVPLGMIQCPRPVQKLPVGFKKVTINGPVSKRFKFQKARN